MMQAPDNWPAEKNGQNVQNPRMVSGKSLFKQAFLDRTRELREKWGGSQADMAVALGIPKSVYEKNETRTVLPHYLIPRFAQIVRVDIADMFPGRGQSRPADAAPAASNQKKGRNRSISAEKRRSSSR